MPQVARVVHRNDQVELFVPEEMGKPAPNQLASTIADNLIELAGRVCYDGQTEVLTKGGWFYLSDYLKGNGCQRGEKVATYNTSTGEMEYQEPTDFIEKRHEGPMYVLDNTKVSIRVTGDHDLFVMTDKRKGWTYESAMSMVARKYKLKREAPYQGVSWKGCRLPEFTYTQRTSNGFSSQGTSTRTTPGLTIEVDKATAWARFLGYFFSEGCVSKAGGGCGRTTVIYQRPEAMAPIRDAVESLGFKPGTYTDKRNGVVRLLIRSGPLARYLDQFGTTASEKRLPRECLDWPRWMRAELLDSLMYGDGHVTENGVRVYNTKSKFLANDVQELIVKSGRVGTISYTPAGDMYRVRESAHKLHTANKHKQQDYIEDADETVYCLTVPNRALFVRRNNKVVVCGNCYDSLGRGRSSAEYHKHVIEVDHGSVWRHVNQTFELSSESWSTIGNAALILSGRPGVYVTQIHGGSLRFSCNLQAVREWDRHSKLLENVPSLFHYSTYLRNDLVGFFKDIAPLAMHDMHGVLECLGGHLPRLRPCLPQSDREIYVSMFLSGISRGLSHELVRHTWECAPSQRSSRYCNEAQSQWAWHPLLNMLSTDEYSLLLEAKDLCQDAYRAACESLQARLTEAGHDKSFALKQARGAARGVLGNALETELIFTASLNEWKNIFFRRITPAADQEINDLIQLVKQQFKD